MKKLVVGSECDGCGICTIQRPDYLRENDEGNAEAIEGKFVQEKDLAAIQKLIARCPQGALHLEGGGHTQKKGVEGLKDIIAWLEEEKDKIKVEPVPRFKFDAKDYPVEIPSSNKEYDYNYSSEFEVRLAAENEFERLCYSERAYKTMLTKIFVEYRVTKLKPYYLCMDVKESAYYRYNEAVRKLLAEAYSEVQLLMDGNAKLPEKWNNICVYPTGTDFWIKNLKDFSEGDVYPIGSVIDNFESRGEYTSLKFYLDRMDFEYTEKYVGEGLFGKSKYKKKYAFFGFYNAAKEFVDDLKFSCNMVSYGFEEELQESAQHVMDDFEKALKLAMEERILALKELCQNNADAKEDDFSGYAKLWEGILGPSRSSLYRDFDRRAEFMESDFIGVRMSDTREPEKPSNSGTQDSGTQTIYCGF